MQIHTRPAQKAHFLFSLGGHRDANDFAKAKAAADSFKPHIFSPESAYLTKNGRIDEFVPSNLGLQKARKNPALRKEILDFFARSEGGGNDYEFQRSQLIYVLDSPLRPIFYPLEAHDTPFHKDSMAKIDALHAGSIQKASVNELDAAKGQMLESIMLFAESNKRRDADIVENMGTFVSEAVSLFPSLLRFNPVRIFVRMGSLHIGAFEMAQERYGGDSKMIIEKIEDDRNVGEKLLPFERAQLDAASKKQISDELALRSVMTFILMEKYGQDIGGKENFAKEPLVFKLSYELTPGQMQELIRANALLQPNNDLSSWLNKVAAGAEVLGRSGPSPNAGS